MVRAALFTICIVVLLGAAACAADFGPVQIHGYMQNRFYANPDSSARFATERVSLSAKAKTGENAETYVEVYFHPQLPNALPAEQYRTYVESAYYDMALGTGRLRVGKGRQLNFGITPSYGARKTTQYGIVPETFTQDRTNGIQYYFTQNGWEGGASLYNDLRVGTRGIGDFPGALRTVPHISERDVPGSSTGNLAITAKIGQAMPNIKWHVSYMTGKLIQEDADALPKIWCPGVAFVNNDRDHNKWGVDTTYKNGSFFAQAEYYRGKFSCLKIDGLGLTVGYEPASGKKAYIRYGQLDNNQPSNANPTTWETQQVILGYVYPIDKTVWAEFQYERNMEDSPAGIPSIDNDLLFVELFAGF